MEITLTLIILGIAIGAGCVLLIELLDNSFKKVEDVDFLKRIEGKVKTLKLSHRDAGDTKFIYES